MKISIPGYGVVHDDEVAVAAVPAAEQTVPVAPVPDVDAAVLEIIPNPTPSPELTNSAPTGPVEDPIDAAVRAHLAAEAATDPLTQ